MKEIYLIQKKTIKGSGDFSLNLGGYYNYRNNKNYWMLWNHKDVVEDKYSHVNLIKNKFLKKLDGIKESFNNKSSYETMFGKEQIKIPFKDLNLMIYTLPMISISSAILEGTLREILAKYLQEEINKYVDLGVKEGREKHNNYQKILVAKQSLIESHSSIGNLLSEYSILFDLKISDIVSKEIIKIVDSLSTLRNFIAHGTSIVTTNVEVIEDNYFKNWNKKIKELQSILQKYFGSTDVYLNLSDRRLPSFYMNIVRVYLLKIIAYIENYDDSSSKAIASTKIVQEMKKFRVSSIYEDEAFLNWFN